MAQTAVATSPTSVSSAGATFHGDVNPDGEASYAYFEYGLTTSYGSSTYPEYVGDGSVDVPVSATVTGLQPGYEYHYRVVLNAGTPPPPPPPPGDFGSDLPTRIDTSTGSVINVTTDAELQTALDTCPFGSIIDGGGGTYHPPNGYYFQITRDGGGIVTTVRNCDVVGEFRLIKGRWWRIEDCTFADGPYFGIKSEGGRYFEILRCSVTDTSASAYMITTASDGTPSLDWQIWDSEDHHCGYGIGFHSHSVYAETHNATCVIANHLSVEPYYFGYHISTDRPASTNPYTDGLIVTGCTHVGSAARGAVVLYGNNQPDHGQRNCILVGILGADAALGLVYCYPSISANNRLYGAVDFNSGADYQLANVDPVYFNGAITVSGVVTSDPDLDGTYHPSGSSSAKDIVPAAQYGYLPPYDKDGNPRVTADAGCYAVP